MIMGALWRRFFSGYMSPAVHDVRTISRGPDIVLGQYLGYEELLRTPVEGQQVHACADNAPILVHMMHGALSPLMATQTMVQEHYTLRASSTTVTKLASGTNAACMLIGAGPGRKLDARS
jgi:hypothetical protein